MSEPIDSYKVNLSADLGQGEAPGAVTPETPFSILVLGDFSGRGLGARARRSLDWRPIRVTPDNLPDLAGFATRVPVRIQGSEDTVELPIESLQSFHPDRLMAGVPWLEELRSERRRVAGGEPLPERFKIDLVAPSSAPVPDPEATAEAPDDQSVSPAGDLGGLLDAIVEGASGAPAAQPRGEIEEFVKEIVRPHLVPKQDVPVGDLELLDAATADALTDVMRQPALTRLEGLWRSLVFLLSRIDTTGKTRVYVVDVSRDELEAELSGNGSALRRLLHEPNQGPAVPRWACVVGAYSFGPSERDARLLTEIGEAARRADLPWLSEALPECMGSASYEALTDPEEWIAPEGDAWEALRGGSGAHWLGLALPGFQARATYGGDGLRTRVPGFEERPGDAADLVWGNAAFVWAALWGRGFARRGWSGDSGTEPDIDQVPMATLEDGTPLGPTRVQLTVPGAREILRSGLAPVIGFPHEARVRLGGEPSLSGAGSTLRGWWRD